MTTREAATGTIDAYFDAVNREAWAALTPLLHPQVRYRYPGLDETVGATAVVVVLQRLFSSWTQHNETPTLLALDNDRAVVEVNFDGTGTNGRRLHFTAVDVFQFEGARFVEASSWFDTYAVRSALRSQ